MSKWALGALCIAAVLVSGCARAQTETVIVPDGDADRGRVLLGWYGCGACHEITKHPAASGRVGPPLTGFGSRGYIAGRLPNTPENLQRWIMHPQQIDERTIMPEMGVGEDHVKDIAEYLYRQR